MTNTSFNMPLAIRSGYAFVAREWKYLARFALLPMGVALVTDVFAYYQRLTTVSYFEDFIWTIPTVTLFGWVMFIEIRLLLLGERPPHLPAEPGFLAERKRDLVASVLIWVLFNMAAIALYAYMDWGKGKSNPLINFFWLFLIGAAVWGVRFMVAPILAAVGYPIRKYVFQVNGIAISLRLGALYVLTCLPIWFFQLGFISLVLPDDLKEHITDPSKLNLPDSIALTIIVIQKFGDLAVDILSTAVFCFALKEILSRPRQEKTV